MEAIPLHTLIFYHWHACSLIPTRKYCCYGQNYDQIQHRFFMINCVLLGLAGPGLRRCESSRLFARSWLASGRTFSSLCGWIYTNHMGQISWQETYKRKINIWNVRLKSCVKIYLTYTLVLFVLVVHLLKNISLCLPVVSVLRTIIASMNYYYYFYSFYVTILIFVLM